MYLVLYSPLYLFWFRERCLLNIRRMLFTLQNFGSGIGFIDGKDLQIRLYNGGSVSEYFSWDLGVKTLTRGLYHGNS